MLLVLFVLCCKLVDSAMCTLLMTTFHLHFNALREPRDISISWTKRGKCSLTHPVSSLLVVRYTSSLNFVYFILLCLFSLDFSPLDSDVAGCLQTFQSDARCTRDWAQWAGSYSPCSRARGRFCPPLGSDVIRELFAVMLLFLNISHLHLSLL